MPEGDAPRPEPDSQAAPHEPAHAAQEASALERVRRELDELTTIKAQAARQDPYPKKSVCERAIGPSDLDALRAALQDDLRRALVSTTPGVPPGFVNYPTAPPRYDVPQAQGHTSPGLGLPPTAPSTAPLDAMAANLCTQLRSALHYVDDLVQGPTPEVMAVEPPPHGIRARLELADALLDQLNGRLSIIVNQVGVL